MLKVLMAATKDASLSAFVAALAADPEVRLDWAESGAEALAKAAQDRPDLVVMEEQMPDMSGFELARRLLSVSVAINTAVISALPAREFHQAGEGLGIMAQLLPGPGQKEAEMILGRLKNKPFFSARAC